MERIKGRQVAVDFVNAVKVDQAEPERTVDLNDMADMQIKADVEEEEEEKKEVRYLGVVCVGFV